MTSDGRIKLAIALTSFDEFELAGRFVPIIAWPGKDRIRKRLEQHQKWEPTPNLEITESAVMANPELARQVLERLRAMGVLVSIDDFGTGYSSLGWLKRLPVNEVEIDKSFVQGIVRDQKDLAIVSAVIQMAHSLELLVVAEGVEDQATLDALTAAGCDLAQGYHISRPLPAVAFREWFRASDWSAGG